MLFKNDKAVSPVVATLVLVVVAIIGAAAVGALLGAFSSDVSSEASAGETSSASSSELIVGGSTTVQPVTELLADAFMKDHKGVKITVQGGGSGAGVAGAEQAVLDIGSSSDYAKCNPADHPDLEIFEIGGSAVVVIGKGVTGTSATAADLKAIYSSTTDGKATSSGNITGTAYTVYQRSEDSGTEETFAKYIDLPDSSKQLNSSAKGATGNAGIYEGVRTSTAAIGFVDYGFCENAVADGITVFHITEGSTSMTPTDDTLKSALKSLSNGETSTEYPVGLCRNLYYVTLGTPSATEKTFVDFAMSPAAIDYFHEAGYFSIYDYKF